MVNEPKVVRGNAIIIGSAHAEERHAAYPENQRVFVFRREEFLLEPLFLPCPKEGLLLIVFDSWIVAIRAQVCDDELGATNGEGLVYRRFANRFREFVVRNVFVVSAFDGKLRG